MSRMFHAKNDSCVEKCLTYEECLMYGEYLMYG